jgi:hypothetical protein
MDYRLPDNRNVTSIFSGKGADDSSGHTDEIMEDQGLIVGNPGHVEDRFCSPGDHSKDNPLET